jgi:AcrR family transcriptional regulator
VKKSPYINRLGAGMEAIAEAKLGRRERRKLQNRARIQEVALNLLSGKPLEEVTVDEICEQADIAKKTFYNYYPSRHDLIETISEELLIRRSEENCENAIKLHKSTRERLEYFLVQQGLNLSDSEMLEKNLIKNAMIDLSVNSDRSREKLESTILLFEKIINEGKQAGDVNENYSARFLAETVSGIINTSAIHWIHYPDYPVNKRFNELKSLIMDIVLK